MKSSLYFRALIFCEENKGLILNGMGFFIISTESSFLKDFVQCNRSLVFKSQRDLDFPRKITAVKIK
jgi:hypothetical protein